LSVLNALTVDVEDYFQVSAFDGIVPRSHWDRFERRVVANTRRLLDLFDESGVRATFFVLGWISEREPDLVRAIAARGHELGSHGYGHRLLYEQTPAVFAEDLHRAKQTIEDAAGQAVIGYRAPSFSITPSSQWALDVLAEQGYAYDASVYPIHHDRYGLPGAARHPYIEHRLGRRIVEAPGTTVQIGRLVLPAAGGGYFRLYPYALTRWAIQRVNTRDAQPAIVYVHPWEVDPDQPRIAVGLATRLRHYVNLRRTEPRLRRLLADFPFASLADVLRGLGLLTAEAIPAC
jgi:polysaccharide deacetylase family protein (PEP-CTERM system associated)